MLFYTSVNRTNKNYSKYIEYRGYLENGKPIQDKIAWAPTYYVRSQNKNTKYKDIYGTPLEPMDFPSMAKGKKWLTERREPGYNNKDFIKGLEVYGTDNYMHQFITSKWPGEIKFKPEFVNVVNFDIEVASDDGFPKPEEALQPIISIALKSSRSSIYHVWGLGDYDYRKCSIDMGTDLIQYRKFNSEKELLASFHMFWCNDFPDIVTGWNSNKFDVPYLINRLTKLVGEHAAHKLSPFGEVSGNNQGKASPNYGQSPDLRYNIGHLGEYVVSGIQQVDYLDLFKKFGYSYGTQESYKLDHIAHVVLGEKKLSYEEHGNLYTLYQEDHQKFIDYNIKDVQLVNRIEEKMGLIQLAQTMAYKAGVNIHETFGTTSIWDSIIYRELNRNNIIPPPNRTTPKTPYPGGYVKEPQVGLHDWVVSFDLNSLYPNLIVQYNMSPETIVSITERSGVDFYLESPDKVISQYSVAANGSTYRKDRQGILPNLIESFYAERSQIKKEMLGIEQKYQKNKTVELEREINRYNNRQMAIKILLNSLYGALGNQYFRYFNQDMAEGITLSGQLSVLWAEKAVNEEMNNVLKTDNVDYVIAIDTDSLYINMGDLVNKVKPKDPVKFLDQICSDHFEKVLSKSYAKLFDKMNAYKPRMEMGREVIADRGIWTAKKRYILNVHNSEGVQYAEPKLKIMGIEAIKSSTPEIVRDKFKEAFKIIINGSEDKTQEFITNFYNEFRSLPPENISFPRGAREVTKWATKKGEKIAYKKGTPIHIRGSLLYNGLIDKYNLHKKYAKIQNGEKVKFCYLRTPNPIHENVIAFPDYLPKEFGLEKYVDYDLQFSKTFSDPLKPILDPTGWFINYDNSNTLEEFFV